MFDAPQRRAQHRGYHRRFVPGGHQYCEEARPGRALQLAGEGTRVAAVHRDGAPHPPREIDQVDEQIVGGEDQEADRREQSEFGGDPGEKFHRVHERRAPLERRDGLK
jgi:hypothetical protein